MQVRFRFAPLLPLRFPAIHEWAKIEHARVDTCSPHLIRHQEEDVILVIDRSLLYPTFPSPMQLLLIIAWV